MISYYIISYLLTCSPAYLPTNSSDTCHPPSGYPAISPAGSLAT